MTSPFQLLVATLVTLGLVGASASPPQDRPRYVEGNVLVSGSLPAASITVDESFRYVGRYEFAIGDIADGERFVFADADSMVVNRLFVAHFEGIRKDSDEVFRYSFDDAMELGGFRFRQNVWSYRTSESRAERPDSESAKLADLLDEKGFTVADHLAMSRYVMVPDEERKHEMILFYLEPWLDSDTVSESDGADLHERAMASFSVEAH